MTVVATAAAAAVSQLLLEHVAGSHAPSYAPLRPMTALTTAAVLGTVLVESRRTQVSVVIVTVVAVSRGGGGVV